MSSTSSAGRPASPSVSPVAVFVFSVAPSMPCNTSSGSATLSGVGFLISLRKLDPLGSLAFKGRFVAEVLGVEVSESDEERGCMFGRGGSGPGPVLLVAGEYGRECGGVLFGVDWLDLRSAYIVRSAGFC